MLISDSGIALIKRFEGFSPKLYPDGDRLAIGYGCDLSPAEAEAYKGCEITEPDAEAMLRTRLMPAERDITVLVRVEISQNQFDALCSLAYNIGLGAFGLSTLLSKLNAEDTKGAAEEFLRWNKIYGVTNSGLASRRAQERAYFLGE